MTGKRKDGDEAKILLNYLCYYKTSKAGTPFWVQIPSVRVGRLWVGGILLCCVVTSVGNYSHGRVIWKKKTSFKSLPFT